ncbi:MAG TPA: hypothetical protein VJB94_03070 [Candidatus Nanoarchaeia archaeon]|nr:hypothetical protein [Candidatus Nanoarchaeia archaeon]
MNKKGFQMTMEMIVKIIILLIILYLIYHFVVGNIYELGKAILGKLQ